MSHLLVDLARAAIRTYLERGEYLDVSGLSGDRPAQGVFVSLHDPPAGKERGRLRGCRGSVVPQGPTLHTEVVRQAVNSAVDDPRCPSVVPEEVDEIEITVYLLSRPQPVLDASELDPVRYGVIVEAGTRRRALLLPGIPGIETAQEQVALTRQKAFIGAGEPVKLYRFEAEVCR